MAASSLFFILIVVGVSTGILIDDGERPCCSSSAPTEPRAAPRVVVEPIDDNQTLTELTPVQPDAAADLNNSSGDETDPMDTFASSSSIVVITLESDNEDQYLIIDEDEPSSPSLFPNIDLAEAEPEQTECPIGFRQLGKGAKCSPGNMNCPHIFCVRCLYKSLERKSHCPLCRRPAGTLDIDGINIAVWMRDPSSDEDEPQFDMEADSDDMDADDEDDDDDFRRESAYYVARFTDLMRQNGRQY